MRFEFISTFLRVITIVLVKIIDFGKLPFLCFRGIKSISFVVD